MKTLLIVLLFLTSDSALSDPCFNHTILNQAWRSTNCTQTVCSGEWKSDHNLEYGWYRFKSSGGWKLPEGLVADYRCSGYYTGWLKGSHPTVEEGEVNRTVCFSWSSLPCSWNREIKIKNCSHYVVYELKPTVYTWDIYCTAPDTALSDPCDEHTILDQAWRSTDCAGTACSVESKSDKNLQYGWYRFKSSGGWKIPEKHVADNHCSGSYTGWLQGSHPTVEEDDVLRTVCFSWGAQPCSWNREIKIKNCSRYFVYELKPTVYTGDVYCTAPASALSDPCVDHIVLDQAWRNINCRGIECSPQLKCDTYLTYGWYRFKSSGGWRIPEKRVPEGYCSTYYTGWMQGSHPTTEEGKVSRIVCFNQGGSCSWKRDIKVKNCSSYFVYELKPTPQCDGVYCTDPNRTRIQEPEEQTTREYTDIYTTSATAPESPTSDPHTTQIQEPEEQTTREYTDTTSAATSESSTSDPHTTRIQEPEEQTTREYIDTTPAAPSKSSISDFQYKAINVEITSVRELSNEAAKKIAVKKVQQVSKDQCPNMKFELKLEDVRCWDVKPEDPWDFNYVI